MNTIFKHKILTGAMLCGALLMASCDDSEGLKPTPEVPYADKTLLEVMTSDPQLTDFLEVVNSCGGHCADSLFGKSRVYTVWAPINGTFNKDSLIEEAKGPNRDIVFHSFVKAHIANHLRAANGTLEDDNLILLLNEKMAAFAGNRVDGYTFDGNEILESNIRVWNGILHKISTPAQYKYNIWEYLRTDSRIDSVSNYLYSFDVTEFAPLQSIIGPIVNGEQTYVDSVFVTSNKMLSHGTGVGFLNREDSLYTVYVPVNEVWNELLAKAEKHFNYSMTTKNPASISFEDRDSLKNHYMRSNVVKYLTYSDNVQVDLNNPDSLLPIWNGGKRKLFAKADIEEYVIFEKGLSNGTLKIMDKSPFDQFDLWHDTIKIEGENQEMRFETSGVTDYMRTATKNQINKDSIFAGAEISGGSYYEGYSERANATARFKLPDVLSAKYNVAIIIVPKNITNENVSEEELKPCNFTISVTQGNKELYSGRSIKNDPTRLDTMFLMNDDEEREVLEMPNCEYYKTYKAADYNTVLEIKTSGSQNTYDKSIRVDAILLIPVEDGEE